MTRNFSINTQSCAVLYGVNTEALYWIITMAFDRSEVIRFLPTSKLQDINLWPSSLYQLAAEHIARSETLWAICEHELQSRLPQWLGKYDRLSPWEICKTFQDGMDIMGGKELAAVLWILVNKRDPVFNKIICRFQEESLVIAGRFIRNP